jgi:hypothetical protein
MITIIVLFSITPSAQNNHIIFEEIGEMTGTISNLHNVIPINIQGLKARNFLWTNNEDYIITYTKNPSQLQCRQTSTHQKYQKIGRLCQRILDQPQPNSRLSTQPNKAPSSATLHQAPIDFQI